MLILLNEIYLQAIEKITTTNSWITALIMLLFFCIVLLKLINANKLKTGVYSLFNITFVESEFDENSSFFSNYNIVNAIFTLIVLSLLAFNFKNYITGVKTESFDVFLPVFLSLFTYFIVKRILEYLFYQLFIIKNEVHFYLISRSNYLQTVTFLLYIAIVLNQYTGLNKVYSFYFAIFLFIVRFVIHLFSNKNLVFNKLFYFILYICAFEIAPLFLLFKLMF